jgi:hypothetical protein
MIILQFKKKLQLALQLNSLVATNIWYSLYLYVVSANKKIAWVVKLCENNSFSTIMQLHNNYTHDVTMRSLIAIHPLKSNMWDYNFKFLDINFYFYLKYWSPLSIMIVNDGLRLWHMAQSKISHGILIVFWKKN